jgi:fructokinase
MAQVICLGELLIDFCATDSDVGLDRAGSFVKAPGGAPANVAVALRRLGVSAAFVGAVGDDPFGRFLTDTLREEGVDTEGLASIPDVRTTLAFIASRSDGRKDISFHRHPGADMCLEPSMIDGDALADCEVFHHGSISLIDPGPSDATDKARRAALAGGAMITYDPNWRPTLWPDADEARETIRAGFQGAHVAKISDEEWAFLTGTDEFERGGRGVIDLGCELVVRSEGPDGASFVTSSVSGHVDGFDVDCVEPTGAGDAFMACLIAGLLGHWRNGRRPGDLDEATLAGLVRRANAVGALACTGVGAIPSLPSAEAVEAFLAARG